MTKDGRRQRGGGSEEAAIGRHLPGVVLVGEEARVTSQLLQMLEAAGAEVRCLPATACDVGALKVGSGSVLVLVLFLPTDAAASLVARLRAEGMCHPAVALSEHPSEREHAELLHAGADACLALSQDPRVLLAQLEALARRIPVAPGYEVAWGQFRVRLHERKAYFSGRPLLLTRREHALLCLLVEARGRVVTRSDIYACWQAQRLQPDHRLDVMVYRLRKKMGEDAQALRTERGEGLRLAAG